MFIQLIQLSIKTKILNHVSLAPPYQNPTQGYLQKY